MTAKQLLEHFEFLYGCKEECYDEDDIRFWYVEKDKVIDLMFEAYKMGLRDK